MQIVVLTPFPLHDAVVKGGGERAARAVCDGLLAMGNDCVVLRSDAWREPDSAVAVPFAAQYFTQWHATPVAETQVTARQTAQLIRDADLVISVDRAFGALSARGRRVLLLSNLVYANERTAAEAQWDAVWVPSPYLADQLRRTRHGGPIHVVPPLVAERTDACRPLPAVDRLTARLAAAGIDRQRRLLFPHRADPSKGLHEAVDLLARLHRDDDTWHLIVCRHTDEGARGAATMQNARVASADLGVADAISWIPWLPAAAMPQLYEVAGCTLVASRLPEAFSLVSLESVMAGVPVVARSVGNITELARQFPAIQAVDTITSVVGVRAVRAAVDRPPTLRERVQARGMFGADAHRAALASALHQVLAS